MRDYMKEKYGYTIEEALKLTYDEYSDLVDNMLVDEATLDEDESNVVADELTELCREWIKRNN